MKKGCFTLSILLIALAAEGAFIYQDDFSGLNTEPLNGTAPGPGSETWSAGTNFKADGSVGPLTLEEVENASAILPFSPEAGKIYILTADLAQPTGTGVGRWIGIGFGNSRLSTGTPLIPAWRSAAALLYRGSGNVESYYGGDGTGSGGNAVAAGTASGTQTLKLVLDTTGANWKVDYFYGANAVGSHTFDGFPGDNTGDPTIDNRPITSVGISYNASDGFTTSVDNFELSVIPEPATLLLLGLGGLALRRKQR